MRKPVIAAVMVWSVVCSARAGEVFSLRIDAYPAVAPRGCPIEITVEIRNVSGHAVTTGRNILRSGGYGLPDEGGGYFSLVAKVQDATGSSVAPCPRQFIEDDVVVGPETPSVLPANWQLRFRAPLCIDHVGSYKVMLVAREQGPFIDRLTNKQFEIWSGEVDSQEVAISIVEPTGVDREAYEYFKGRPLADTMRLGELLQKFPTSTYAAYVIFLHAGPPSINTLDENGLSILLASLRTGILLTKEYPDDSPTSTRGWRSLSGEAAASWLAHWYEIILSNHPDLWFADELKLKRALDQLALHNMAEGEAQLAALAKQARPEIAEWSGQFLALVKQKGLVK